MGAHAIDFFFKRKKKERDYSLTRTGCSLIKRVQSRHHGCACCRKKKKVSQKFVEIYHSQFLAAVLSKNSSKSNRATKKI